MGSYSVSQSGSNLPMREMYQPPNNAEKKIGGFKTYSDYLSAYNAAKKKSESGGFENANPYSKKQTWVNPVVVGSGGFGMQGGKGYWGGQTAYTEGEFEQMRAGQNIATGQTMKEAYDRALAHVTGMTEKAMNDPGEQQLFDWYKNALLDPQGQNYETSPEYLWGLQQGEESVRRLSPRLSGARAIAATKFGQGYGRQFRAQDLATRLSGAQEERARREQNRQTRLSQAQIQANLMTRPEDLVFQTYWGTQQPWSTSVSVST